VEVFKKSLKSICHNCININEICSSINKTCGTDSKMGLAYIEKCSKFNKDITEDKIRSSKIVVQNKSDSRIEMMGGGFKEVLNGNNG